MKILVIEDENSIREVITAYLKRSGFLVTEAVDGKDGLKAFSEEVFDLVVLDLNLPFIDGIEVCKQIRKNSSIPIIMLTARVEEIDEIIGLEIGADDYIKKPFMPNILVARINSLLRRVGNTKLEFPTITIDPDKMIVVKNNKELSLTNTQFNILYSLARSAGKVFTRDELIDKSYGQIEYKDIYDRTIDAHIKSIRKCIEEDPKKPKLILTVIGKGYKFNA